MKPGKRAPESPLGPLLFRTWFVAAAGVVTGVALPLAMLIALLLTLLFLHLWLDPSRRRPERDQSPLKPSGAVQAPKTWTRSALRTIREIRRRTRRQRHAQLPIIVTMPVMPVAKPALLRFEEEPVPPTCPGDERWSGLLTLLSLVAALLTGTALVRESAHLIEINEHFYLFRFLDLLGVSLLPLLIGILCRSEIHSILTMVSLSAAFQAVLLRLAAAVPEGLFLALAALAIAGIPLGLVCFWGIIDRRLAGGCIETTTGKLLRSKWQRACTGKCPADGSRESS
jgi:hypothetical protein